MRVCVWEVECSGIEGGIEGGKQVGGGVIRIEGLIVLVHLLTRPTPGT